MDSEIKGSVQQHPYQSLHSAMCEKIGDFYDNLFDCIDRHEKNYNEDDGMFLRFLMIFSEIFLP